MYCGNRYKDRATNQALVVAFVTQARHADAAAPFAADADARVRLRTRTLLCR